MLLLLASFVFLDWQISVVVALQPLMSYGSVSHCL